MVNNRDVDRYVQVTSIVKDFIKRKRVQVVLGAKVLETETLRCFLYNWLGSDEKFYSLVVPHTEATIYNFPEVTYVSVRNFDSILEHNLKSFDTRDAWQKDRWSEQEVRTEMRSLKIFLDNLATGYLKLPHHSIQSIMTHLHPVLGMTIWYKNFKEKSNSITIWFDSITTIEVDDEYIEELLTSLHIEDKVQVMQCAKSLMLEEVTGFDNR